MNKRTEISLNQEEVQYIIDCYEKDIEYIKQLKEKVNQLETKINTYENPEDMTLMFMWCDEKAKDKIKQLEKEVERLKEREKLVTEHYDVMVRHAGNLEGKIIQLETNIDEVKEEIKDLLERWKGNDLVERDLNILLSLLERGKE